MFVLKKRYFLWFVLISFVITKTSLALDSNITSTALEEDSNSIEGAEDRFSVEDEDIEGELANAIINMIRATAPMLIAIEENKKLQIADVDMADKIKTSLPDKYNKETSYIIDENLNSIEFDGEYEEKETILRYRLSRNIAKTMLVYNIINQKDIMPSLKPNRNDVTEKTTITNLKEQKIDINKFKVNKIKDNKFAGYSNKKNKEIYLIGNIGAYTTIEIQANGEDFARIASDFIYSLDEDKVRNAISDDNKTIDEVYSYIEMLSKDPNKIDEIFEKRNQ